MATLLVSQGVAMLHAGDEIACTQEGNNNAYCQDNELSWLDWEGADREFLDFCARMVDLRRRHPVFRRRRFFIGRPIFGAELSDIGWFRPDGKEMTSEDWNAGFAKSLGVFLNGEALPDVDSRGQQVSDDSFLVLLNAHYGEVTFVLPGGRQGELWVTEVDTFGEHETAVRAGGASFPVAARSMQLLRRI
jgi:glycogen operon protein